MAGPSAEEWNQMKEMMKILQGDMETQKIVITGLKAKLVAHGDAITGIAAGLDSERQEAGTNHQKAMEAILHVQEKLNDNFALSERSAIPLS